MDESGSNDAEEEQSEPHWLGDDEVVASSDAAAAPADADAAPAGAGSDSEGQQERKGSFLKELPVLVILAFALAIIVKTFLLQAFYIPSESMVPTLAVGDRVLVNKLVYHLHEPRRGDIVVFIAHRGAKKSFLQRVRSVLFEGLGVTRPADVDFIKRVIALPGEKIQVRRGVVTITPKGGGKPFALREPYLSPVKDTTDFPATAVPAGHYFVMGDNRTNSADSRSELGPVPRDEIVGRAFIRIWPIKRFGLFHRPAYQGLSLVPVSLLWGAGYPRRRGTRRTAGTKAA